LTTSEQEIETNLAKGIYGADKRPLAELVLARKKLARVEAQRTEEMGIARSATEPKKLKAQTRERRGRSS
jgi:hypothetical protein